MIIYIICPEICKVLKNFERSHAILLRELYGGELGGLICALWYTQIYKNTL